MIVLEIETHEGVSRVPVERERLSIGRLAYNDIVLPYSQISRQHAEMRNIQGQWWIADLHSTNGLRINSTRVQEHQLAHGDVVVFAPGISMRFLVEQPSLGAQRPPATPPQRQVPPQRGHAAPTIPPPGTPLPPLASLLPRSPFADDEDRLPPPYPGGNGAITHGPVPSGPPPAPGAPQGNGHAAYPPADATHDPFRRAQAAQHAPTAGPAQMVLHVCQTCGQRTAPDAVFCQSCHHSIAQECPKCQLSLLPVQERCPRCQTPNASAVRRAPRAP